jgi:hypothetical protein
VALPLSTEPWRQIVLPHRRGGALQSVVLGPWYVGETPDALTLQMWSRTRQPMPVQSLTTCFEWWIEGATTPVTGAVAVASTYALRLTLPSATRTGRWRGQLVAVLPSYTIRLASLYAEILPSVT